MNSERIIRQLNRLNSFLRFDFSKLSDFQSQQNEAIHTLQQQNEMLRQQVDQLTSSINMLHETASKRFNLYAGIYNPELSTLSQILSDKQYNILICGYYGAPNLGDELMLQTLLDFFGYYKDIHVTVIIHDNQYLNESVYGKVSILHYPKTR